MGPHRQDTEENASRIEPCFLDAYDERVADLLVRLPAAAHALGARLAKPTAASLADLVRVMNCYYSNLIEGHNTRPRDIERVLANELETAENRRNLQLEARAHITLQREIDELHARGTLPDPTSVAFLRDLHRKFYSGVPESMLWIEGAGRRFKMQPGALRSAEEHEVVVGRHQPPSSRRVLVFMEYFEQRFAVQKLGASAQLVALASAHYRFNYIHPFPDGNGRVSRLMSHAMCLRIGIGAHGLWSISRGLARGLLGGPSGRLEYHQVMDAADSPREGDLDGRGNLSRRRLQDLVVWFLRVCLDQVEFMSGLFDLDSITERYPELVRSKGIRAEAHKLLNEALVRGEVARGEAGRITGLPERTARVLLGRLVAEGLVASTTPKGPVSLRFPIDASEVLFPRLFAGT